MKIEEVKRENSFIVITDEDEYTTYIRYSEDCWYYQMGESQEPVYNCEEIEKLFKEYCIDNLDKINPKSVSYEQYQEAITLYKDMVENLLDELKQERGIKDYLAKQLRELNNS